MKENWIKGIINTIKETEKGAFFVVNIKKIMEVKKERERDMLTK